MSELRTVWMVERGHFSIDEYDGYDGPDSTPDAVFSTYEGAVEYVTSKAIPVHVKEAYGRSCVKVSWKDDRVDGFARPVIVDDDKVDDGTLFRFKLTQDGVERVVTGLYRNDELLVYERPVDGFAESVGDGPWAVYAVSYWSGCPSARAVRRFQSKDDAVAYLRSLIIPVTYVNGSDHFTAGFDPSQHPYVGDVRLESDDGVTYRYRYPGSNMPVRGSCICTYVVTREQ